MPHPTPIQPDHQVLEKPAAVAASPSRTLGVVGGGGAATALLWSLAERAEGSPAIRRELPDSVLVFERSRTTGPGSVYRDDLPSARINREAAAMSVSATDPGHFARWRAAEGPGPGAALDEASGTFPARSTFGTYLGTQFTTAVRRLRALGTRVEVVHDEVVNLLAAPDEPIQLLTRDRQTWAVGRLVLAMGAPPQPDLYNLEGTPGYHRDPFPLNRLVRSVPADASVAVLGTGLTAVDIAVALTDAGLRRPLHLLSRTGMLPRVRAELPAVRPVHFTAEHLARLAAARGGLELHDLAELLQRDAEGLPPLADVLERARRCDDPAGALRRQLAGADADIAAWQQVLAATNPAVETAWRLLNPAARRLLHERYHRPLMNLRNPMPRVNAHKLSALLDSGALRVSGGLRHVGAYSDGTHYAVLSEGNRAEPDPYIQEFDVVISAIGPDPGVDGLRAMPLTAALINQGLATPHRFGGVAVTDDHELISAAGTPDPRIHALGNLTAGSFYYTSSMEMVARQAERMARLLLPAARPARAPLEVAA
ncbi:FAD/NAD(P)-binding protein [Streptomyces sp. NPDC058274]|uniref:FAD/NAD(P)-binding protein n=1 Tax=Streptomyces sp. NPDC058274 TaxID=3346416 RepID=UPI0036EE43AB